MIMLSRLVLRRRPIRLAGTLLPTTDSFNWDVLNTLSNGMIDVYNQWEVLGITGAPSIMSTIALGHLLLVPAQIKLRQSYFKYSNERIKLEYLALRYKIGEIERNSDRGERKAEFDAFKVSGPIDYKYLIPSGLAFSLHALAIVNLTSSMDVLPFLFLGNVLDFDLVVYMVC